MKTIKLISRKASLTSREKKR